MTWNSKSFKVIHCSVINVLCCFRFVQATYLLYHSYFYLSTTFLFFFFSSFEPSGEGGIWTLAPLLTTCTLSRGVPSASLGTSPNCLSLFIYHRCIKFNCTLVSGEDGIRTHVPLRTNGFQDRLVMTTSIPLRASHSNQCRSYFTIHIVFCQQLFAYFFIFIFCQ